MYDIYFDTISKLETTETTKRMLGYIPCAKYCAIKKFLKNKVMGAMGLACCLSYSREWGRRTTSIREFEACLINTKLYQKGSGVLRKHSNVGKGLFWKENIFFGTERHCFKSVAVKFSFLVSESRQWDQLSAMVLLLKKQVLCGVSDSLACGNGSNARDTIHVEADEQYNGQYQ